MDWPLLRFNPNEQEPTLQLDVSREKLRTAPEYKANPRPQILMVRPAAGPASTTAAGRTSRRQEVSGCLAWPTTNARQTYQRAPVAAWIGSISSSPTSRRRFGPFIAVYLSSQSWTQTAIGLALSIGTVSSMASQVPAGALVDAMPNKTRVAAFSVLVFTVSALMFAIHPIPLFVYLAEILHGISSCTLGPAIAAMSLVIAGRFGMGLRLGRNARYAAIGNGVGAALMGACGQYVSERAVFFLTAGLTLRRCSRCCRCADPRLRGLT